MEQEFWQTKWQARDIGFHKQHENPLLTQYLPHLKLQTGARIFLPLCGKTKDISWLNTQGYNIVGVELIETAVIELFEEMSVSPQIEENSQFKIYQHNGITIFVGDFFQLTQSLLGPVDAIYDRAALVALPKLMRIDYVQHLIKITNMANQLLICFEYDQSKMGGPPFSINEDEIFNHYSNYPPRLLTSQNVEGGLKQQCQSQENVWLLKKNHPE